MSRLPRRSFLRGAAALVALGAAGCGATPVPTATTAPPTATKQPTAPPAPAAPAAPTAPPTVTPLPTAAAQAPAATATVAPTATVITRTPTPPPAAGQAYLAVAHGASPEALTRRAVAAIGGIGRFVKAGDDVIIKPNICSASYPFEYAATTNPEVVATLVTMCREAGAKRVRVMDQPFSGTDGQAYAKSGIEEAVKKAGGEMELMARMKFQKTPIPKGRDIKSWDIYQDVLTADVLIDVPIAKDHGSTRLTLGMKNLMGVILNRNQIHLNLHQRIADLTSAMVPTLTVVDAVRILTRGGPTGGNLSYVKKMDTVIASHDVVAADAYATTLFGMTADDIDHIRLGAEMGLGRKDINNLKIERLEV